MKKIYNNIIPTIVLIQPIIDILTSYMSLNGYSITIGMVIKIIMLGLFILYLLFIDKNKYNKYILLFISIFSIFNIINNIDIIKISLVTYFSYLIKYLYFIITTIYFIRWYKNGNKIDLIKLRYPLIIIEITFLLSIITNTAIPTYATWSLKKGISGWYYSPNEFSSLLSLLFPISIYNAFHNPDGRRFDTVIFIVCGIILLSIGTKVGLLGFYITMLVYIIYRFLFVKKYKFNKSLVFVLLFIGTVTCFFNKLPGVYNTNINMDSYNIDIKNIKKEDIDNITLSGRNNYVKLMLSKRDDLNIREIAFGKSFFRDKNVLLITEQDFYDIYFMYGIVGALIVIAIIIYVYKKVIKEIFKDISTISSILLLSSGLTFCIAFISGHTLMSPSINLYLSLILCETYFFKEKKYENNILISSVHLDYGGIETTLINLLKKLYKYNIDLLILKQGGVLYNEVPKNINLIGPYDSNFMKKIVLSNNKICKIINHLLYNKYTAWLYVKNKKYDIAISYSGYYDFIDYYVVNSISNKKYIWLHTDPNSLKVIKTKKYKNFDKVVCVSESAKNNLIKKCPEIKEKVTYCWNFINYKENNIKDNYKLDGKYNIVSIGRLYPQKRFDRLIEAAKILDKKRIDFKIYIIGDGLLKKELEELINKNKLEEKVILLGKKDNVEYYLKQADLFISTSDYEGLTTVLFESLINKLPIVATNICGNVDIYKYIAPKGSMTLTTTNPKEIAETIIKQMNKKRVNIDFDIEKYNKKVMEKLERLLVLK